MKKFLSVILSVILIFSAVSVTAFAAGTPKAEDILKSLDLEKGMEFEICVDYIPATTLWVKGNKVAAQMNIDGFDLKLILKDGTLYMYFTDFPFVYFEHEDADMPELDEAVSSLEIDGLFVESFEKEYNSKTYYVEKYAAGDGATLEYYFLDDELKMVRSTDDENYTTEIEIISTEVDDDVFELPFFCFNITPILNLFFNF